MPTAAARREATTTEAMEEAGIARTCVAIRGRLIGLPAGEWMSGADLGRKLKAGTQRPYRDQALDLLLAAGEIEADQVDYLGRLGWRYRLTPRALRNLSGGKPWGGRVEATIQHKHTIRPPRTGGVVDAAAAALAGRIDTTTTAVRVRIRRGAHPAPGPWSAEVYLYPGSNDPLVVHTGRCQNPDDGPHDDCITLDLP